MKVYVVDVSPEDLIKPKAESLQNFPIPMPRADLKKMTDFCREQGINRCEWARRVLLASFAQMAGEKQAG